ncbi:MAG: muconolactone Delta-isomerase [Hydrogenophaga sp.]|uniref:muconolactone Delta-isomerase n=1 Tax=Hydrogenophaga sp. TaxID=1904254 RepID=UPI0040362CF4
MQFMVNIVVRLPGDMPKDQLDALVKAETQRGMQCIREGKLKRIFRVVGQRANFSIWEASSLEELHATLFSLPMHPFMDVSVSPVIKHSTTEAWEASEGALPPF